MQASMGKRAAYGLYPCGLRWVDFHSLWLVPMWRNMVNRILLTIAKEKAIWSLNDQFTYTSFANYFPSYVFTFVFFLITKYSLELALRG